MNPFALYGCAVIVNEGTGKDEVKAIIVQAFLRDAFRYVDAFPDDKLPAGYGNITRGVCFVSPD
jgi:hypothetical protein